MKSAVILISYSIIRSIMTYKNVKRRTEKNLNRSQVLWTSIDTLEKLVEGLVSPSPTAT